MQNLGVLVPEEGWVCAEQVLRILGAPPCPSHLVKNSV